MTKNLGSEDNYNYEQKNEIQNWKHLLKVNYMYGKIGNFTYLFNGWK